MLFDDVGDGVLGDAEVAGDPAIASPISDGLKHFRRKPAGPGLRGGFPKNVGRPETIALGEEGEFGDRPARQRRAGLTLVRGLG